MRVAQAFRCHPAWLCFSAHSFVRSCVPLYATELLSFTSEPSLDDIGVCSVGIRRRPPRGIWTSKWASLTRGRVVVSWYISGTLTGTYGDGMMVHDVVVCIASFPLSSRSIVPATSLSPRAKFVLFPTQLRTFWQTPAREDGDQTVFSTVVKGKLCPKCPGLDGRSSTREHEHGCYGAGKMICGPALCAESSLGE